MTQGILYISYDGMLEPLGQSQVLAYLEKLAPDRRIHLISYEKPRDWHDRPRCEAMARRLAGKGIRWHPLRYHRSPTAPATAYDVAVGTALAIALVLRFRLRIIHARSYVSALIALMVKRVTGAKFLFDMRGFWADERVDGGLWPANGRLYQIAKRLERCFLLASDHVVTLTHASEAEVRRFPYLGAGAPPTTVIPTCADLDRFTVQGPPASDPFVLGYVGSVGTWYMLDEMLRCFRQAQQIEPAARLLIVNRGEQGLIRNRATALGIDLSRVEMTAAEHHDMPRLIGRMSAGMALYRPSYSRLACAPTKLAEYLGCGVPVLGTSGVGDMDSILEGRRVGVTIREFSDEAILAAVQKLIGLAHEASMRERCRQTACELLSLDAGVASYAAAYRQMLGETA